MTDRLVDARPPDRQCPGSGLAAATLPVRPVLAVIDRRRQATEAVMAEADAAGRQPRPSGARRRGQRQRAASPPSATPFSPRRARRPSPGEASAPLCRQGAGTRPTTCVADAARHIERERRDAAAACEERAGRHCRCRSKRRAIASAAGYAGGAADAFSTGSVRCPARTARRESVQRILGQRPRHRSGQRSHGAHARRCRHGGALPPSHRRDRWAYASKIRIRRRTRR